MKLNILDIGIRQRFRKEMGEVGQLAEDMKSTGQITAVTVRASSEDDRAEGFTEPWMLLAGGRRMAAAMLLGWMEIDALTKDEIPIIDRLIIEHHENIYRKELTWDEEVALKAEIHRLRLEANPAHKQYQTAQELGVDAGNLTRELTLAEEIEKNPDLKKAGSKKAAMRIVEMTKHLDKLAVQSVGAGATKLHGLQSKMLTMDARDFLRLQEDASIDMVYSDPPWGIDFYSQGQKVAGDSPLGASEYDDSEGAVRDVIVDIIPQMVRVCKPTGWIVLHCGYDAMKDWTMLFEKFCTTHMCYDEEHSEGRKDCKYLKAEPLPWIWYRPNSQNPSRFPELHAQNAYEFVLVVNRGEGKLLRKDLQNVLMFNAEYGSRIHAMQKPQELCKEIISRFTFPSMTVCDPFFGSGALLAAAASMQRDIIGSEMNPVMLNPAMGFVSQYYTGV